jgi:hypothetical protein
MEEEKSKEKQVKNPLLAIILSAILPGLGQIYISHVGKGLFFIGFNMLINFLIREPLVTVVDNVDNLQNVDRSTMIVFIGYSLASMALWIYAVIDAKINADNINKEAKKTS